MAQSSPAQSSPLNRPRALIVEDELLAAVKLEQIMGDLGFDVCSLAPSSREARAVASSQQPDVVLMDVNLDGGREAIELARWFRKVYESPIVFVTGCTDGDTVARIHQEVPGAPVLPKPVWRDRLVDAVAAVMKFRMW